MATKHFLKTTSGKLSFICFGAFFVQLVLVRNYALRVIENGDQTISVQLAYWLGMLWIGLGSLFWYRATQSNQTKTRQLLAFLLGPIVLLPLIGIAYALVVLLPLYELVGETLN